MTPYNPIKIIYFAGLGKIHVTFLYFLPWKIIIIIIIIIITTW
jgi:hypothetical protein